MNITQKTKVALSYALTVDGKIADQSTDEQPLEFIFGMGMLLPDFEKNIEGKTNGDEFKFTLTPENGYGELNAEAVVELPKEIFMVEGQIAEEVLTVGNVLPMGDNQGNKMMGTVKEVKDDVIVMDFNHPMAGKTLNFEGKVLSVTEATDEDLQAYMGGGGCGCGDGGCSEGGCGDGGCGDGGCGEGSDFGGCGDGCKCE